LPLAAFIYETVRSLGSGPHSFGAALLVAGGIHLVERRGKKDRIDPKRQLEISTLLESIPEAAIIVDAGGRVIDANSIAGSLVSRTREELRGRSAAEISLALRDQQHAQRKAIIQRGLEGQTVRHERRTLRNPQSGTTHELLVSANPIMDEHGHVIAALVIARDVTELTRLQQRVGDIERHRAIGQMAAALAHDFNNILDTIGQAAAVLEININRPADVRKPLLDMIQNTVRRGAEMVQRIREYLRTGHGALRPLNVCTIIDESVELTRPLWEKAHIELIKYLQPVPNVKADAADLRRVFTNLIINAMEAMPNGGRITIDCQVREDNVVATVADMGVGIAPEEQKKVFFAYFTTKPQGTGLGLSGAQKILLSYGGNISFQSEVGKGTTFIITLPVANGKATKVA
jgi:two-component system cell cycle sensor histidine kinase/response regulator CckA